MTEAELDSVLAQFSTKHEKLWYLERLKFDLDMQDYWYQDDHNFWDLLVKKIDEVKNG